MDALLLKLYWIQSWQLGVLIFAVFGGLSILGLLSCHPWISRHTHKSNDLVFNFVAIAGVVYALAVGLIAVATWDKFKSVQEIVNNEAYALNNLYLDVDSLPEATAVQVKNDIRGYLHFVLTKEWSVQEMGRRVEGGDDLALGIMRKLTTMETATPREGILLSQALLELNKFLAQRRARQNALTEALPGVLYFLVLGGAAVLIVMTFFLWTEEFWLQIALTLALAAMISFVVFMIVAMDHPLWGPVSASPEAFENVLHTVGK
jgi:hypothetical protein